VGPEAREELSAVRPVAVIQHEPSVPAGSIARVLETSGVEHFVVETWRTTEWPRATDLGALVVMGGTMNVDELDTYPFLRKSRALMAEALEEDVPALGVCLGSQMMARVLGGDVYRADPRNAFFSSLILDDAADGDPVIGSFGAGTEVLQFHEDTFTLPPGATPLARSAASGLHQAFRYGDRAYAIQFHFEVDAEITRGWCRNIGPDALAAQWNTTERELVDESLDRFRAQEEAGRRLFTGFLDVAAPATRP
jgi:GMP synthase (glutamine-hydrolysing)